jgi:tRNA threonylcarbamoyladenosine biosynthesis protein TsaB
LIRRNFIPRKSKFQDFKIPKFQDSRFFNSMVLLHIETATRICSVALSIDGTVTAIRESSEKNIHSSIITIFIDEILKETGLEFPLLDAICVSKGPGSYTGLRIGVSTAKGLCYALDKPLIAIGTLQALAWGARQQIQSISSPVNEKTLFCPMIDARRMEVYYALYDTKLNTLRDTRAEVIHGDAFNDLFNENQIWFTGDGAEKCRELFLDQPNACFIENPMPSAAYLVDLAEQHFQARQFEDTAYFEPFYLKDFIPGIPKVKGLQ